jgi:hypothetical protein
MAPEQLEKPGMVDHRADIYSLGVVFYEMLTGELPLGRFQPPSRKVDLDVRLDEVVLHALEKEPSRRYQHASQVKTAVETIAGGTPPPPAPGTDRFWKRMALAMSLLCLMLIVLIAAFARSFLTAQKAGAGSPTSTAPVGGTEKESGTLVIDTEPFEPWRVQQNPHARDMLFWNFKYLIPANHLVQVVFVLWSNGVPAIKPGFSGYIKVGPRPFNVDNMTIAYDPYVSRPDRETNVVEWSVGLGFGYGVGGLITNLPPCRQLETAPRSVLHSGGQLAIRLAEFVQPAGSASNGWSGVELRLLLEPLTPPVVQTVPTEFDHTNYVAGWGLAEGSEVSLMKALEKK